MATISRTDLTDSVISEFATVLENMATACGAGDQAVEIAGDERQLLTPTNGGNISETASKVSYKIPMVAWEFCQSEEMNVDFFAKHGALLTHTAACMPRVSAALSQKSQNLREDMNYRMKQLLVLHSEENQLGHQLTQHMIMKQHGVFGHLASPAEDPRLHIRVAAVAELTPKKRAQLEYLQTKKWQTTHGLSPKRCKHFVELPHTLQCQYVPGMCDRCSGCVVWSAQWLEWLPYNPQHQILPLHRQDLSKRWHSGLVPKHAGRAGHNSARPRPHCSSVVLHQRANHTGGAKSQDESVHGYQ